MNDAALFHTSKIVKLKAMELAEAMSERGVFIANSAEGIKNLRTQQGNVIRMLDIDDGFVTFFVIDGEYIADIKSKEDNIEEKLEEEISPYLDAHLRTGRPFVNSFVVFADEDTKDIAISIMNKLTKENRRSLEDNHAQISTVIATSKTADEYTIERFKQMEYAVSINPNDVEQELREFIGNDNDEIEKVLPVYFQLTRIPSKILCKSGVTKKQIARRLAYQYVTDTVRTDSRGEGYMDVSTFCDSFVNPLLALHSKQDFSKARKVLESWTTPLSMSYRNPNELAEALTPVLVASDAERMIEQIDNLNNELAHILAAGQFQLYEPEELSDMGYTAHKLSVIASKYGRLSQRLQDAARGASRAAEAMKEENDKN